SERALRSDRGESRATISVMVKPASCNATARKVASLPAPTMAKLGLLVVRLSVVGSSVIFAVIVFQLSGAAYLILLSWRNRQEQDPSKPTCSLLESATGARYLASPRMKWK